MDIQTAHQQFLEHLEIERGLSLKTVENYDRYLQRFYQFATPQTVADITEEAIRKYRLHLNRQPGIKLRGQSHLQTTLKKRTQNYHLIAIRVFLKYLTKRGQNVIAPDTIDLAKVGNRELDLITSVELTRLLQAPAQLYKNFKPDEPNPQALQIAKLRLLRDTAILETLFSTGLRVSELCRLNNDIDITRDELSVHGKGEKVRVVFLSNECRSAIADYLKARTDFEEALFVSLTKKPTRLTSRSIERLVAQYAKIAGISKKVTPHVIRHSFATNLLRNGADLRSVQAMLGHANITTTQVYTHVTDTHLRDVHKRFHKR